MLPFSTEKRPTALQTASICNVGINLNTPVGDSPKCKRVHNTKYKARGIKYIYQNVYQNMALQLCKEVCPSLHPTKLYKMVCIAMPVAIFLVGGYYVALTLTM